MFGFFCLFIISLLINIIDDDTFEVSSWKIQFFITLDKLWHARNILVFEMKFITPHHVCVNINGTYLDVEVSFQHHVHKSYVISNHLSDNGISWTPLCVDHYKLNYDGVVVRQSRKTSCGYVLCDNCGRVIYDFTSNLGLRSITHAELWPIFLGVKLASEREIKIIIVESNSQIVVGFLNNGCSSYHPYYHLIKSILNRNLLGCILTWLLIV